MIIPMQKSFFLHCNEHAMLGYISKWKNMQRSGRSQEIHKCIWNISLSVFSHELHPVYIPFTFSSHIVFCGWSKTQVFIFFACGETDFALLCTPSICPLSLGLPMHLYPAVLYVLEVYWNFCNTHSWNSKILTTWSIHNIHWDLSDSVCALCVLCAMAKKSDFYDLYFFTEHWHYLIQMMGIS